MEMEKRLVPLKYKFTSFNKKILGFDIETHGKKNKFVLATFKNDEEEYKFYNILDMIKFLNSPKLQKYIIVATNLPFDFLGCFYHHRKYWRVIERKGVIYSFTWFQYGNKKKKIKFYDTIHFFQASVEKLGKIIGTEKMKHPSCFAKLPKNKKEWNDLEEYCLNDSYISYKFFKDIVIKWHDKRGISLSLTMSSASLKDFRTNFLTDHITVEDYMVHDKIFKAYYGGRTETFKRGTFKRATCYDFNSEYAGVLTRDFPDPNTSRYIKKSSMYHINNLMGVSYIEGIQDSRYIPPLPVRIDGKLKFPTGIIKGWYVHEELQNAMKNGFKITKVCDGVIYTATKKYFKGFINTHYNERLQLKKEKNPLQIMEKNSMNGLYGKWAFNYRESNSIENLAFISDEDLNDCDSFTIINDRFIELSKTSNMNPTSYSFPIWSAYATAYARMDIYRYLSDPLLKSRLISCDTDSIFLDISVNDKVHFKTGDQLGDMAIEDNYPVKNAIFVKPKLYFTVKPKLKGVKFDWTKTNFELREVFIKILQGVKVEQERFVKYRTAVKSKPHHKWGVLCINEIIDITKTISVIDDKRLWQNDFDINNTQDSEPVILTIKNYEGLLLQ